MPTKPAKVLTGTIIDATHMTDLMNYYNEIWAGGSYAYDANHSSSTDDRRFGWGQTTATLIPTPITGELITADVFNQAIAQVNAGQYHISDLPGNLLIKLGVGDKILNTRGASPANAPAHYNNIISKIENLQNNKYVVDWSDWDKDRLISLNTQPWDEDLSVVHKFSFTDYNEARHFFNSGGELTLELEMDPGGPPGNDVWRQVFDQFDSIRIGAETCRVVADNVYDILSTSTVNPKGFYNGIAFGQDFSTILDAGVFKFAGAQGEYEYAYVYVYSEYNSRRIQLQIKADEVGGTFNVYVRVNLIEDEDDTFAISQPIKLYSGWVNPTQAPVSGDGNESYMTANSGTIYRFDERTAPIITEDTPWNKVDLASGMQLDANGGKDWVGTTLRNIPVAYLTVGKQYVIKTIGTTDWTTVGASDSNLETVFTATQTGVGTGIADEIQTASTDPGINWYNKGRWGFSTKFQLPATTITPTIGNTTVFVEPVSINRGQYSQDIIATLTDVSATASASNVTITFYDQAGAALASPTVTYANNKATVAEADLPTVWHSAKATDVASGWSTAGLAYVNNTAPVQPTQPASYQLTMIKDGVVSTDNVAEDGTQIKIKLNTTNVADGVFSYEISGNNITTADINNASLTGSFTTTNGVGEVLINISADSLTEGVETLTFSILNTSASINVLINDTSISPTVYTNNYDGVSVFQQMEQTAANNLTPTLTGWVKVTDGSGILISNSERDNVIAALQSDNAVADFVNTFSNDGYTTSNTNDLLALAIQDTVTEWNNAVNAVGLSNINGYSAIYNSGTILTQGMLGSTYTSPTSGAEYTRTDPASHTTITYAPNLNTNDYLSLTNGNIAALEDAINGARGVTMSASERAVIIALVTALANTVIALVNALTLDLDIHDYTRSNNS
jgi:hypothetical protein